MGELASMHLSEQHRFWACVGQASHSSLCRYGRVDGLTAEMPLGCKVLLQNVDVRRGLLLLHNKNTLVLGGAVAALAKQQSAAASKHNARETAVAKEQKRNVAEAAAAAALVMSPPRGAGIQAGGGDSTRAAARSIAAPSTALDADIQAAQAEQRAQQHSTDDDALLAALLAEEEAVGGGAYAHSPPGRGGSPDSSWDDAALEAAILAAEQQHAASAVKARPSTGTHSRSSTPVEPSRSKRARRSSHTSAADSAVSWQSPEVLDVFSSPEQGSHSRDTRTRGNTHTVTDDGGQQVLITRQAMSTTASPRKEKAGADNLTQVLDLTSRLEAAATATAAARGFVYDEDEDEGEIEDADGSPPHAGVGGRSRPADSASRPVAPPVVDVTRSDSDSSDTPAAPQRQQMRPGTSRDSAKHVLDSSVSSKSTTSASQSSGGAAAAAAAAPQSGAAAAWDAPQRFEASMSVPSNITPLGSLAGRGTAAVGNRVFVRCICRDVVGSLQYEGGYRLQLVLADASGTVQVHLAADVIQWCIGAPASALTAALQDKSPAGKRQRKEAKARVRQLAGNLSKFIGWASLHREGNGPAGWEARSLKVCFDQELKDLQAAR